MDNQFIVSAQDLQGGPKCYLRSNSLVTDKDWTEDINEALRMSRSFCDSTLSTSEFIERRASNRDSSVLLAPVRVQLLISDKRWSGVILRIESISGEIVKEIKYKPYENKVNQL